MTKAATAWKGNGGQRNKQAAIRKHLKERKILSAKSQNKQRRKGMGIQTDTEERRYDVIRTAFHERGVCFAFRPLLTLGKGCRVRVTGADRKGVDG